jgi:protoporphyrinogen oxidase
LAKRTAIIIGGGPAGLTAALELLRRTDIKPIVYEASDDVGGIARTYVYKGNHIDIGGHRFFSKSDRVMAWWRDILPLQGGDLGNGLEIRYQNRSQWLEQAADGPDPDRTNDVMLVRSRKSRILWAGNLFDYPLSLNLATLRKMGALRTLQVGVSYIRSRLLPVRPERSLEDFFINRFGRRLYGTFFKDYTEKVWGVPCSDISAEWGAQRVKGLSLTGLLRHAIASLTRRNGSLDQKGVETSLIERFLYPKFGPGQVWSRARDRIVELGGEVHLGVAVAGLEHDGSRVTGARLIGPDGKTTNVHGDFFFSTMPVRDLIANMQPPPAPAVREISDGLMYRDFVTVGVLLDRLKLGGNADGHGLAAAMSDNWIYVQEPGVKVGRLQFFNNWSPYMVADASKVWIGLEYFCDEGDEIWSMDDAEMGRFAADELARIGVIEAEAVRDHVVIRVPKTYPAYFGTYDRFDVVRGYLDGFANLYPIGRNGMHRYNNMDHSMLTAMVAVDNIAAGHTEKANIWSVNTEAEYHEEK